MLKSGRGGRVVAEALEEEKAVPAFAGTTALRGRERLLHLPERFRLHLADALGDLEHRGQVMEG